MPSTGSSKGRRELRWPGWRDEQRRFGVRRWRWCCVGGILRWSDFSTPSSWRSRRANIRVMQALICKQFGRIDALQVGEMPAPVAGAGQVAIDVEAAAVNFPDGLMVQGKYQLKPEVPFVPGAEIAGTVHSAGDGVTQLKPGDRVVAVCRIGGFAERVVADAD